MCLADPKLGQIHLHLPSIFIVQRKSCWRLLATAQPGIGRGVSGQARVPVESRQKKALAAGADPEDCRLKWSDKVQQQFLGQEIVTHRRLQLPASPLPAITVEIMGFASACSECASLRAILILLFFSLLNVLNWEVHSLSPWMGSSLHPLAVSLLTY